MTYGIYRQINKIRKEVHGLEKDTFVSTGGNRGYNAVSHDAVIKKLRASMVEHEVIFFVSHIDSKSEMVHFTDKHNKPKVKSVVNVTITVKYVFAEDGSSIEAMAIGTGEDHGDKAAGKALSYAVKNCHLKTFALDTGLNDEERIEYTEPAKTLREWSEELRAVTDIQSLKAVWEMIPAGEMKVSLENLKNDIKYRLENR